MPGHGERGLGDVGGQHDAARAVRRRTRGPARPATGARTAAGSRRRAARLVRQVLAQVLGGLADLALAGQEDQHVARPPRGLAPELVDARRRWRRSRSWSRRLLERAASACSTGIEAARHLDHRRRAVAPSEVLREALGVDRRRGDDHLQVGPARQDLAQVAEQEVDVQAALVRLVDDDRVVGAQQRVALRLGEQDAVGHQLDRRRRARAGPGSAPCSRPPRRAASSAPRRCAWRPLDAAMRRGCVWPISPPPPCARPRPSASAIFGSWVVLPEPVSPQTMTTWCAADRARAISSRRALTPAAIRETRCVGSGCDGARTGARQLRREHIARCASSSACADTRAALDAACRHCAMMAAQAAGCRFATHRGRWNSSPRHAGVVASAQCSDGCCSAQSRPCTRTAGCRPSLVFPHTFVPWFRSVAPYIHAYRGKTFVVGDRRRG